MSYTRLDTLRQAGDFMATLTQTKWQINKNMPINMKNGDTEGMAEALIFIAKF